MKNLYSENENFPEYLSYFCEKYSFQREAYEELSKYLDMLFKSERNITLFTDAIEKYRENPFRDFSEITSLLDELQKESEIHRYTLDMLYYIMLTPRLKELYSEKGYSDGIFDRSVLDLKWKLFECKNVYGIWGLFVPWWTCGFFQMKLFALGRLQFEVCEAPSDLTIGEFSVKKGEHVINVHIPSCGPLVREEYLLSYEYASSFFRTNFGIENTVFHCSSWLLSPTNISLLSESSRIRKFASDYYIIHERVDPKSGNSWRIFNTMEKDPEKLPEDTSMQRAFKKHLVSGGTINSATGMFFYKNGQIISK